MNHKTFINQVGDKITPPPIGSLIWYMGPSTKIDTSKWIIANGASLLISDYPELWNVFGNKYGQVDSAHYSIPDLVNSNRFIRANWEAGYVQDDAIRNITGGYLGWMNAFCDCPTGMYQYGAVVIKARWGNSEDPISILGGGERSRWGFDFDASRVVPTADENRPRNISAIPLIRYA